MNYISFEVKVRTEDKEKFLTKNKQLRGPAFHELEASIGYHKDNETYAPYYAKDWDNEVILYTSVGIYYETRVIDLLGDISHELNIDLKYISCYQPDELEDASGEWGYFEKRIKPMTRKEMIESIAQQAGCSKRLVRKKLFARFAELDNHRWDMKFTGAFSDKKAEWLDFWDLYDAWGKGDKTLNPWKTKNTFRVEHVTSGCVVLFHVERISKDHHDLESIGARLYSY